ncbi:MAG: hypothetical protein LPK14_01545, partial [Hymenobacteraceae bacterium]|nr:hypothetical protein [Hymenobacteraceae bacterium]
MKMYVVFLFLINLFMACSGRNETGQEAHLAMLASQREAITTSAGTADTQRVSGEIPYRPYWAYHNDKSDQDFAAFFDGKLEQNPYFGPSGHSQVTPNEMWFPFPDELEAVLEEIHFYDWKGKPRTPIRTYFIERGSWKRIEGPAFTGEKYRDWSKYKLSRPLNIAYMVLENSDRIFPTEIKLIGSYRPYDPQPYKRKEIKINDMLGVNGYVWNFQQPSGRGNDAHKFALATPFTMVRDYVDWEKIEYYKGIYTFSPVYRGAWDYD